MNQVVNLFWTILCFIPLITYWITAGRLLWCFIFIGVGLLSLLFPLKFFQLSNSPRFYESLGVRFIRKFVQQGEYVNRFIRKTNPNYRIVKHKANAVQYLKTTVMYERFHFICLVFFLLTAIHAIITRHYPFFIIILIANIIYNVGPILLQQYNRVRIARFIR